MRMGHYSVGVATSRWDPHREEGKNEEREIEREGEREEAREK